MIFTIDTQGQHLNLLRRLGNLRQQKSLTARTMGKNVLHCVHIIPVILYVPSKEDNPLSYVQKIITYPPACHIIVY